MRHDTLPRPTPAVERPGLWIGVFALGIVLVFVLFLVLTARPDLREAMGAGAHAGQTAGADAVRTAYASTADSLRAWFGA